MRRVEAARMPDHADEAGLLLHPVDCRRVVPRIGEWNLDLHVLAGLHALHSLCGVKLRRRAENHRLDAGLRERDGQIDRHVWDAVFLRDFLRRFQAPADDRYNFHSVDELQRIEMLLAEGADAGDDDLHDAPPAVPFSRITCPTAVFDAGT
jgi:hypothetical protein